MIKTNHVPVNQTVSNVAYPAVCVSAFDFVDTSPGLFSHNDTGLF